MRIKITSPGEYDRHEDEVRFSAQADGRFIDVKITTYALFIIREALEMPAAEPLTIYAASGRLLEAVVKNVVQTTGELSPTYLVTHNDVLRVTGSSGEGNPHVPKIWKG